MIYSRIERLGSGDGPTGAGPCAPKASQIEHKFEFAAHGWDTADGVGSVNRATIPGVCSDHGSLDPDEMCTTIGTGNGHCLVQVSEEALNADSLVVATRSRVKTYAEKCTGVSKDTTDIATSVDDN